MIDKTKNLDASIKKVWGDSTAQSERNLKREFDVFTNDFYASVDSLERSIKVLVSSNRSLQQQVKVLGDRLEKIEKEKDSSLFKKIKKSF